MSNCDRRTQFYLASVGKDEQKQVKPNPEVRPTKILNQKGEVIKIIPPKNGKV